MVSHIITGEFVQLVMHVVIRKDISEKFVVQTPVTVTIYEDPSAIAAIHCFLTYNCTTGITAAFPQSLSHAAVPLSIQGHSLTALVDSCSSDSFMSENIAKMLKMQIKTSTRNISMAPSTILTKISGYCRT